MTRLAFLFLVLFSGLAYSSPSTRIIGGWPTTIERYPSIVQVDYYDPWVRAWVQSCAANILNSRYVLTAAHCFAGWLYRAQDRRVRAGSTYRHIGGAVAYVEREFNHPSFGQNGADGDISVVRLSTALIMSSVIQQGLFISPGLVLPDNLPVTTIGWGETTVSGEHSSVLLETEIFTINNELCAARYQTLNPPLPVTQNMICTGILDHGGRDSCQGDSGGPLYYNDGSQGDIIVGIISWGEGCASGVFPGVNTAISPYIEWVSATAV